MLADFDADNDQWALIMEDVATFAVQKLHENELTLDEVMQMVPGLVDVAVAWGGAATRDPRALSSKSWVLTTGHRTTTWRCIER